jgi:MAF protein
LIALLGHPFEVVVAGVDEDLVTDVDAGVNARETARLKARAVAERVDGDGSVWRVVVAADTVVVANSRILGKPSSPHEAITMLKLLRGTSHQVHTGLTLIDMRQQREWAGVQTSIVTMRHYTDAEIDAYVASGDPLDKAGAYGIQHPTFQPVAQLDGCYTGVMGLSVCHLTQALREWDLPVWAQQTAVAQAHRHYPCPILPTIHPWLQH